MIYRSISRDKKMNYFVRNSNDLNKSTHFCMWSLKRNDQYLTKRGWVNENELFNNLNKTFAYKNVVQAIKERGDKIVAIACEYAI